MKQYQGSVIQVIDNNIIDNIPFITGKEAEEIFLRICKEVVSNFDNYTKEDIDTILEDGYEEVGKSGFIAISWFV